MKLEQKGFYRSSILVVIIVLSFWLFGQLYEAVVYSPNWIHDPVNQIKRLSSFYKITSARNYFEPIVPLGVLILWILFFLTKSKELKKKLLPSFIFSVLAMAVNIYIVVALLLKIFSEAYWADEVLLRQLLVQWNIFNIVRIIFISLSLYFTFKYFLYLEGKKSKI